MLDQGTMDYTPIGLESSLDATMQRTETLLTPRRESNTHIHVPPNFSAFRDVEQAVFLAQEQGVGVLGCSNYYDFSVYREFANHCAKQGVFPLFGVEVIVFDQALADSGVRINDPKNPGKMYLCGKGLTRFLDPSVEARRILEEIKAKDEGRARKMIRRLNDYFLVHSVRIDVSYDDIVGIIAQRHGVPPETICLQERHLAEGYQRRLLSAVPVGERKEVLTRLFAAAPSSLDDPMSLQDDIRTHLMKAGKPAYVKEEFVTFEEAQRLVLEMGGIPCYPVLIDGASQVCEFEASPEALLSQLQRRNIHMVEFIPGRNSLPNLARYAQCLHEAGIVLTFGTEHNTPHPAPLAPSCAGNVPLTAELKRYSWEGACVVAAHQYPRRTGRDGYVDSEGRLMLACQDRERSIREFVALGEHAILEFWERRGREGV